MAHGYEVLKGSINKYRSSSDSVIIEFVMEFFLYKFFFIAVLFVFLIIYHNYSVNERIKESKKKRNNKRI